MQLEGKELCGKNIYVVKKPDKLAIYHHEKKVGELELNDLGNVISAKVNDNRYVRNLIFYINLNKNLIIDDIKEFPCNYKNLNAIKEKLHPDILFKYAIIASSTKLAKYALDREASMTKETFISSAIHSTIILEMHLKITEDYVEEAMNAAFINKNYDSIKILAKKTKNLSNYIDMCNQEEKYQVIKKLLIKELVSRNQKF